MKYYFFAFIVIFFLAQGCGSQNATVNKYYVIEMPEEALKDYIKDTSVIVNEYCEIEKTNIYPAFATRKIANRSKSNEIKYYAYHEWAVRPEEYFSDITVEFFEKTGTFKGIASRYWEILPKYKLKTSIFQIEVINKNKDLAAHLGIEFILEHNKTRKTIISYRTDKTIPLAEKNLNLFAENTSKMFYESLKNFNNKIKSHFQDKDQ